MPKDLTRLSLDLLYFLEVDDTYIDFAIRNKLIGFPLSLLEEVKGDFRNLVAKLKYELKRLNDKTVKKPKFPRIPDYDLVCGFNKWYLRPEYFKLPDGTIPYRITTKIPELGKHKKEISVITQRWDFQYKESVEHLFYFDCNKNLIMTKHNNERLFVLLSEMYNDGQLKRLGDLYIPFFNKKHI